jgi:uncharacterized protein (DUF58 family)
MPERDVTCPPIERDVLRRAMLHLRKSVPNSGTGAHLRRRAGQSLEFREYRDYQMGDDIRLVDWRASFRSNTRLARVFEAEQRTTLIMIVDARPAMRLPDAAPKLLLALWTIRALAEVAAVSGDTLVCGTFYGAHDARPISATGRAAPAMARSFARRIWAGPSADLTDIPRASITALQRQLRPASAVVFLSDLLFADPQGAVAGYLIEAQKSWRQVFVQPIDSVDAEMALARNAGRLRIAGTEGRTFDDDAMDLDETWERGIRDRIAAHKRAQITRWDGPGLTVERALTVPLDAAPGALERVFASQFLHSGLLGGIAARGGAA